MRPATGQALRWVQRVVRLLIPLALLASLAIGGFAWRLAEGPLPVPMLARQIERAVNAEGGLRLEIGDAAIAWEGWRAGTAAPVDIRLAGVRLRDAAGALRADLPEVVLTLSMRALLQGRIAPATVELRGPSFLVTREADGSVSFGPGIGMAPEEAVPATAAAPGATPVAGMLEALHRSSSAEGGAGILSGFRRLRVLGAQVLVQDRALNRRWSLAGATIDLRRNPAGGLAAEGAATAESVGMAVPVRIAASMPAEEPPRLSVELMLPALRPAELAVLWPELAPLRLLDAPVTLVAIAALDATGAPPSVRARLLAGTGALDFGDGRRLPIAGVEAVLEGDEGLLRLTGGRLRLPGRPGPELTARGEARRGPEGWSAALDLELDRLVVTSLPALWPAGLADAVRGPALTALAGGTLHDLRLGLALAAAEDFSGLRLREARADFALEGARLAIGAAAAQLAPAAFAPGGAARRTLSPEAYIAAGRIELAATATPAALRIERLALRLPPPADGAPPTTLALTAAAGRDGPDGAWQGSAELLLDALRLADLPRLWPEGLRPNERAWLTQNLTAGTLRNGRWRLAAAMPGGPETLQVTDFGGTLEAVDATVHWLRPVPPVQGVAATASFSLSEIVVRTRGGRQLGAPPPGQEAAPARQARPTAAAAQRAARSAAAGRGEGTIEAREATIRFLDFDSPPARAEIEVQLGGPLPEILALLRHPRLRLFERRPLEIGAAAGAAEARLTVGFPLLADLPFEAVKLRATGRITEARLTDVLMGHDLERAALDLAVDTEGLKLNGQGTMAEAPLRLAVEMDFRAGPPTQVTERAQVTVPRAEAPQLAAFGLDTAGLMEGTAAVEARYERRRSGQGSVALRGDLREARLHLDVAGWEKPAGAPGLAEAVLRLAGDQLTAAEGLRIESAGLAARGRIGFLPGNRLDRVEIAPGSRLGATQFGGVVTRPQREGGPWRVVLRGPLLDLEPVLSGGGEGEAAARPAARADPAPSAGPAFSLDLRFDRATNGPGRVLSDIALLAELDRQGVLRAAQAGGRAGPNGAFSLTLTPRGAERHLRLTAADGGALLHALDLTDSIAGGRLTVTGVYPDPRPGAPLLGTAELDDFVVRNAPALGKLLQAMTLYGLVEAMQGGSGLVFARLVAPFALTREALGLEDARAFSASLGLTAKGRILRRREIVEIEGTVVPAYFFNQLLGNIPLVGRLFSPERGGGVFAATYRVQGPLADPVVTVNPLAALTPGFLRGIFGLAEGARPVPAPGQR